MYKVWSSSLYFCFVLFDCQSVFFSSAYFPPICPSLPLRLSLPLVSVTVCVFLSYLSQQGTCTVRYVLLSYLCFIQLPFQVHCFFAILLLLLLTPEADLVFHRPWFWEQIILLLHFTPANICIANKILHDTAPWTKPFMRQTTCWFWPGVVWETFIF